MFPRLQLSAILGIATALAIVFAGRGFCQKAPNTSHEDAPSAASQPSPTETQWNLTEVDGEPVTVQAADSQPYIYLQEPSDKLSGSGGCNRLFGSFDLSGSSLQFHSVASTRMACGGNTSEHESALLEALKLTTGFRISGNLLQLKVDDRVLARFQARKK